MKRTTWLQTFGIVAFGAILTLFPAPSNGSDFRTALSQVPVPDSLVLSEAPEAVVWSENFDAYVTGSGGDRAGRLGGLGRQLDGRRAHQLGAGAKRRELDRHRG